MDFNSEFGSGPPQGSGLSLKNPGVTFFHLLFRTLAAVTYLFGTWFSDSFIGIFVFVVLFLSVDFWTVKNITGRIMVGLRWWNYIDSEGKSKWVFEARNGNSAHLLSKSEITIFWGTLILFPILWAVFFLTALLGFRFQWMVLVIIGLTLTGSNLLGYMRCRLGKSTSIKDSVTQMANTYMRRQMFNSLWSSFTSRGSTPSTSAGDVI